MCWKLFFSPTQKKLVLTADLTRERTFDLPFNIESLLCDGFGAQYLISNLVHIHSKNTHINEILTHCEVEYEFASLFKYTSFEIPAIKSIDIQSEQLKSWVLYTKRQQKLMLNPEQPSFDDLIEFCSIINGVGKFELFYDYKTESSHQDYFRGVSFLPTLRLTFDDPCDYLIALDYLNHTLTLMTFLMGGNFNFDKVRTLSSEGEKGYFYINNLGLPAANYAFFPQSINPHPLSGLDIPILHNDFFSSYFKLVAEGSDVWKRYIKYKKMLSLEEKFLGFFRLLEKLTYQEACYINEDVLVKYLKEKRDSVKADLNINRKICSSIFSAVKYGNRNKLNTEACIKRFISKIDGFDHINCRYKKENIGELVKLRNDITHANAVKLNDDELERLTQFTEMLLILSLLLKLGVSSQDSSKIIHRLNGMHLISKVVDYPNLVTTISKN